MDNIPAMRMWMGELDMFVELRERFEPLTTGGTFVRVTFRVSDQVVDHTVSIGVPSIAFVTFIAYTSLF